VARAAGASLVQDLHPADRGPQGTHQGAIICNGCLYCPATPKPLLELVPAAARRQRRRRRRLACLMAVRNQRILTAWDIRQQDSARRAAAGLPARTRKRRRRALAGAAPVPP
jgi:hypothetical protein